MLELRVMATRMRQLQQEKDAMDERWKAITAELDELRLRQIPEWMAENDIRTATIDGIGRVGLTADCYVSILDRYNAYEWLRGHGYEDLIQPYVQPSTMKAAVKDALKQGGSFPEELFKVQPFTRASITKVKE